MINVASLVLRFCLGAIFIAHGLQKAFGLFAGPGIEGFAKFLGSLGFAPAVFWSYTAAYIELIGGLFLLLGIFTRISSSFILAFIAVATIKVHLSKGFFASAGGFEYNLLIIGACIALIALGPGKYAVSDKL